MNKHLILTLVMFLVLIISACGGAAQPAQPPQPVTPAVTAPAQETQPAPVVGAEAIYFYGLEKTTEPVTIRLWLDFEDWAQELMDAFTLLHPNVSFEFTEISNVESRELMLLDGPAGIGADVWAQPHDRIALAIMDGLVEPVPPALQSKWEQELQASSISAVKYGGRMHGAPFQMENIALFYNRDIWGPTAPETWEEILEFSLTHNNPATNDWTMGWNPRSAFNNFIWLTAGGMELFGPNHDDFRSPGFDTPEAARGLEKHLRMRQLLDLPTAEIDFNTGEGRFRAGEVPFSITGPWAIQDTLSNGVNFGTARIPTIDGVQPWAFSNGIVAHVSSFANPEARPWAYAFIDFMVSHEGALIMYEARNTMTTRLDIDTIPGLRDDPFLLGIAQQAPYTIPTPTIPEIGMVWDSLRDMFQFSWDGDLTIPEAQERAMETYRTLLTVAGIDVDF